MKEILELRVNYDYAYLLFKADEGRNIGTSVRVVGISKDDPRYDQIPIISKQIKEKYDKSFFYSCKIKRSYSKKELDTATLLHMKIKITFEPAGEECGTVYDEMVACEICGANRKQVGPLKLKKGSIPKKDIARTIAGEVVVSEKFAEAFVRRGLKGAILEPVVFHEGTSNYYQLVALTEIELSQSTVVGIDPFDFSEGSEAIEFIASEGYHVTLEKEVYKCPKGHTIGLNLLSEPYVINSPLINEHDFFASKQKLGVKRGLLRPEPLYLCSPAFKRMIEEEKLSGFDFEIAHIQ